MSLNTSLPIVYLFILRCCNHIDAAAGYDDRDLPWLAVLFHLGDNIVFDIIIFISATPVENTIDINELNNLSLGSHRFVERILLVK